VCRISKYDSIYGCLYFRFKRVEANLRRKPKLGEKVERKRHPVSDFGGGADFGVEI
jgi:hypothetical protein